MNRNHVYEGLRLGLFVHYVHSAVPIGPMGLVGRHADGSPTRSLDELASGLDASDLASVAQSMHAEYVILTAWHANMNALYPSDAIGQALPGHCSKRDCIRDLINALRPTGIKLILYVHPSDGHDFTRMDQDRVGWNDGPPWKRWNDFINSAFDEIVRRYKGEVLGYWVDGGLPPQVDSATDRLYATIHEGDPEAAIIRNDGEPEYEGFRPWTDYACKETDFCPFRASVHAMAVPISTTWLAHSGHCMVRPDVAFQNTVLQAATRGHTGGGIAWGAGPYPGGIWEPGVREFFRELGTLIEPIAETILNTRPSAAFETPHGTSLRTPGLVVATESSDGTSTYVHVLWPPAGRDLHLPVPQDGRRFGSACLYGGSEPVDLRQNDAGIHVTLPAPHTWDVLDTVIVLR